MKEGAHALGLFAKVVVLRAAVHGHVAWLAVIGVVNTVIGLAYYLRVATGLFALDDADATAEPHRASASVLAAIATGAAAVVALSVYPQPVMDWASSAARTVLA